MEKISITCTRCGTSVALTPTGKLRKHTDRGETCLNTGAQVTQITVSLFNTDTGERKTLTFVGVWDGSDNSVYNRRRFLTSDDAEFYAGRAFDGVRTLAVSARYGAGWTARVTAESDYRRDR